MTPPRALRFISRVVRVSLLSILFKPLYFASSFFSHTTQEFILEGKSLSGSAIELCSSVMSHQAQKKEHGKALRRIILERARREVKNVCEKYENKKKENAVFIRSLSLQFSRTFSTDFSFPPSMGEKEFMPVRLSIFFSWIFFTLTNKKLFHRIFHSLSLSFGASLSMRNRGDMTLMKIGARERQRAKANSTESRVGKMDAPAHLSIRNFSPLFFHNFFLFVSFFLCSALRAFPFCTFLLGRPPSKASRYFCPMQGRRASEHKTHLWICRRHWWKHTDPGPSCRPSCQSWSHVFSDSRSVGVRSPRISSLAVCPWTFFFTHHSAWMNEWLIWSPFEWLQGARRFVYIYGERYGDNGGGGRALARRWFTHTRRGDDGGGSVRVEDDVMMIVVCGEREILATWQWQPKRRRKFLGPQSCCFFFCLSCFGCAELFFLCVIFPCAFIPFLAYLCRLLFVVVLRPRC